MKNQSTAMFVAALVAASAVSWETRAAESPAAAEEDPLMTLLAKHKKVAGPATAEMDNSTFSLPADYLFTDGDGARTLL
jgi:hypothetical protein